MYTQARKFVRSVGETFNKLGNRERERKKIGRKPRERERDKKREKRARNGTCGSHEKREARGPCVTSVSGIAGERGTEEETRLITARLLKCENILSRMKKEYAHVSQRLFRENPLRRHDVAVKRQSPTSRIVAIPRCYV